MTVRTAILVGALIAGVVLLLAANLLTLGALSLFPEDLPGFLVFLNGVGLVSLSALAVGSLIARRVPSHPIGPRMIVGALLLLATFVAWPLIVAVGPDNPDYSPVIATVTLLATVALFPALFVLFPAVGTIFPDGRHIGPRWRLALRGCAAMVALGSVATVIGPWRDPDLPIPNPLAIPGLPPEVSELGGGVAAAGLFLGLAVAVASVVVRFRRSTGIERAQLKWLVAGMSLFGLLFPLSYATELGPAGLIDVVSVLLGSLVPISIGLAILRYRLFDIDRLISRTVSWALVTGVLAAVFAGLVVGLQAVLSDVTQGGTLAVAASTLVAFALFQPVRGQFQRAVDRRFDRARYDGERTAAAFAERLRDRVDLVGLEADIASTVRAVLRPSAVGVWTRRRGQEGR
jgi:hypothetical protein